MELGFFSSFILGSALTTAGLGIVGWIGKTWVAKWLQKRVDIQMAELRKQHEIELEQLKFNSSKAFDRATILHQREFQVLTEIWASLLEAYLETASFAGPLRIYADLRNISDAELEDFFQGTPLREPQREKIRRSSDRFSAYQEEIYWHEKSNASKAVMGFQNMIDRYSIFVDDRIKTELRKIFDLMWEALREKEHNHEYKIRPSKSEMHDLLRDQGPSSLDKIEALIKERIWAIDLDSDKNQNIGC